MILLSFGETFGQINLGPGIAVYELKVVEDVTLESGSTNLDNSDFLIAGFYSGAVKKHSLLKFDDIPSRCKSVNHAMMYIYYVNSRKPNSYTVDQAPFITRTIQAHRVLQSWKETEATCTSTKRLDL